MYCTNTKQGQESLVNPGYIRLTVTAVESDLSHGCVFEVYSDRMHHC